jgi:hypothetical protein
MLRSSWVAAELAVSQEGLSSVSECVMYVIRDTSQLSRYPSRFVLWRSTLQISARTPVIMIDGFDEFSLIFSGKRWDRTSDYAATNSVHILSYSLFTNYPLIRRRTVRLIGSLVRWTKNNTDTYVNVIACKRQSGSHVDLTYTASGYDIRGVGC